MGKAAVAAAIVIGILVVLGGLFYYSYTQIQVELTGLSLHSIDLMKFTWKNVLSLGLNLISQNWFGAAIDLVDAVNVNLEFGVKNNGLLPVYIPDLNYELYVNDKHFGNGYSTFDATIFPGEYREFPAFQKFKKSGLTESIPSIISRGGNMDITVKGTAYFQIFGLSIPVPFESTRTINIGSEIEKRITAEIQKLEAEEQRNTAAAVKAAASAAANVASAIAESLYNAAGSFIDQVFASPQKVETYLKLNVPGSTVYVGDYIRIWGNLYWIDGKIAKGVPNAPIVIDIPTKSSNGGYIKNVQVTTNSQGYFEFTGKALPKCIVYASTWDSKDIIKCMKTGYTISKWGQGKTSAWKLTASYSGDGYRYEPSKTQASTYYVQVYS